MADYVKHVEGKKSLYLIPISESNDGTIYLDFTRKASSALKQDRKDEYGPEKGPGFGTEVMRAVEYAEYLRECDIHARNFARYSTRDGYTLFLDV